MTSLIPSTIPVQEFEGHHGSVSSVGVSPDRRRMVTGSEDKILRLWDMKRGATLKKMEQHNVVVLVLVISRDGKLIASGGKNGKLIAWDGDTGELLTEVIKGHTDWIPSLDFSPDDTILASGSHDETVRLWNTKTWQQEDLIECEDPVRCIRYSLSGEHIGITTESNIQIWKPDTSEHVANLEMDEVIARTKGYRPTIDNCMNLL